jgi:hypothetical protein
VDFKQKIKSYRKELHNETTLLYVDFLETVIEWIETLYQTKRLSFLQKKQVDNAMPSHIFDILDMLHEEKASSQAYVEMKKVLLSETRTLIELIITIGELRLSDFDWLQFNLYQIFGKEELASMVEWARLTLGKEIEKRKLKTEKKLKEKILKEEIHVQYINSLSQTELNHLAYTSQWDFTPSAQTQEERDEALKRAYRTIVSQKKKFRNFELRLIDATTEARRGSQSMIFRKIGEVRSASGKSATEFRKKAKFIVSAEGPRKEVRKATLRIQKGKEKTQRDIEKSGKMFTDAEKMFAGAQRRITAKKQDLADAEEKRRGSIKKQGKVQVQRGKKMIDLAKEHMGEEREGTEKMFSVARDVLAVGKSHLEAEKKDTELSFSSARKYLASGKKRMQEEKSGLAERVKKDEARIEQERQRIIALDKKLAGTRRALEKKMRAEKDRLAKEREKISHVGSQFGGAGTSAMDKITIVKKNLAKQRKRVTGQAKMSIQKQAQLAGEGSIKQKFSAKRQKLEKDLLHKKELLAYDVRFKQHSLQQKARVQKETMTGKFEDFQSEQQKLLARHRATRKAKMVRTLLRAIREMQ